MRTRLFALSFIAAFMATTIIHAAPATKPTAPEDIELRTKEDICLAPLKQGVHFKKFAEIITDDQRKRTIPVSNEARLRKVFASIDLNTNGVLDSAEVLGAKGGDDKYCGASCDSQTGTGCPAKCHCHRNEGRCAKDGY
jgi:hypothetical protein